jgi:hypothetical protein
MIDDSEVLIHHLRHEYIDFGEIDLAAAEDYEPPHGSAILPNTEITLIGRPWVSCAARSLVWPFHAKAVARLVEDWDEHGDLQAKFGHVAAKYDGPRWRASLGPAENAEVRLRAVEYTLCQPALVVVEEEPDAMIYSDRPPQRHRMLLPLWPIGQAPPRGASNYTARPSDTAFRGSRLLCEMVHGPIEGVYVEQVVVGNTLLFAGDGLIAAGIFHPSVSPELHWPTLYPMSRITAVLRNLGPKPVRLRVRVEGHAAV